MLRRILGMGSVLDDDARDLLRHFWLLQNVRTEAASRRAMEVSAGMLEVAADNPQGFRMSIREAVQMSMHTFVTAMDTVDDVKLCLLKNKTSIPFITSDDPAVLANRWYVQKEPTQSFGLRSAGALLLLPLSPNVLCLGYDGDIYSVPHQNGWASVTREADIHALNEHQLLNCRANVFFHDISHAPMLGGEVKRVTSSRLPARHRLHRAVLDQESGGYKRYRVVDRQLAAGDGEALIHIQNVQPRPVSWPSVLSWRHGGVAYTNGTGVGYVRRAWAFGRVDRPFQKIAA